MNRHEKLLLLLSCIDLTSLEATDNEETILKLVHRANAGFKGVLPAAVCVYPDFSEVVRKNLDHSIKTAVVGGYFPSGQCNTETKLAELRITSTGSAEEVDVVINRGRFLSGDFDFVKTEIDLIRAAVPSKLLKVILETGELKTTGNIKKAAEIAIEAGADFIKTSTGKIPAGATPEAVATMCEVILEHYKKTGVKVGIKPSGGIKETEEALRYMSLVGKILGENWLNNNLFRIGASSLYHNLISELSAPDE